MGLDYFLGDPVHLHLEDPNFDRAAWVAKSQKQAQEAVPKWIEEVKKTYGELVMSPRLNVRRSLQASYAFIGEDAVYNAVGEHKFTLSRRTH